MEEYTAEWASAPKFAEVAEALEIETTMILAMMEVPQRKDLVVAIYTPVYTETEVVCNSVVLKRDAYGILRVLKEEELPDFWENLKAQIERDIKRQFGPGEE